jgi:hypothetical protein
MTDQPKFDEIIMPEQLEMEVGKLPEAQKEPARQSLRFGVFLLTVGMVIVVNLAGQSLPVFLHVPAEALQTLTWQIVVAGLGFIGARTVRNKS